MCSKDNFAVNGVVYGKMMYTTVGHVNRVYVFSVHYCIVQLAAYEASV